MKCFFFTAQCEPCFSDPEWPTIAHLLNACQMPSSPLVLTTDPLTVPWAKSWSVLVCVFLARRQQPCNIMNVELFWVVGRPVRCEEGWWRGPAVWLWAGLPAAERALRASLPVSGHERRALSSPTHTGANPLGNHWCIFHEACCQSGLSLSCLPPFPLFPSITLSFPVSLCHLSRPPTPSKSSAYSDRLPVCFERQIESRQHEELGATSEGQRGRGCWDA